MTVGSGFPAPWQFNITESPSTTSVSNGAIFQAGGTTDSTKKNSQRDIYLFQHFKFHITEILKILIGMLLVFFILFLNEIGSYLLITLIFLITLIYFCKEYLSVFVDCSYSRIHISSNRHLKLVGMTEQKKTSSSLKS